MAQAAPARTKIPTNPHNRPGPALPVPPAGRGGQAAWPGPGRSPPGPAVRPRAAKTVR
jgi:hypothetical protein